MYFFFSTPSTPLNIFCTHRYLPEQRRRHIVYCCIFISYRNMDRAQYVRSSLHFSPLYDLINKHWQEPYSKARDESAKLQFWELEVIITLGEGRRKTKGEWGEEKKITSTKLDRGEVVAFLRMEFFFFLVQKYFSAKI